MLSPFFFMLVVNYFPGSYGDRYISNILGKEPRINEHGHTKNEYDPILKLPEFYETENKETILNDLSKKYNIIGAHRQGGFDFVGYDVVSIDPRNKLDLVAERFLYQIENKLIRHRHQNIIEQVIETQSHAVVLPFLVKEILKWCDLNILPSDKMVDINELV